MPNVFKGLGGVWQLVLSAIVFWAVPASLSAQSVPFAHEEVPSSASQPFSRIDDSLARAADTLLVSPAQVTVATTTKVVIGDPPGPVLDLLGARHRALLYGGRTLAGARLDLLRPIIEPILRNRGVPTELVAVIVVESSGRSTALSPKGARGLWQLMPNTARRYGLRVDEVEDDRLDTFKATDAAARYLHDLYTQFGDWKLALAAYNTGESNVGSAILRAHTQDFDQLANLRMLPQETRNYVPSVLDVALSIGQPFTIAATRNTTSATTVFAMPSH